MTIMMFMICVNILYDHIAHAILIIIFESGRIIIEEFEQLFHTGEMEAIARICNIIYLTLLPDNALREIINIDAPDGTDSTSI